MRPWTERLPGRLTFELAEFERLGLRLACEQDELARDGRLVMHGTVVHEGEEVAITVVYPDSFPYLRPEVYAPGLALERHFNPFNGNVCLLDRSSREWNTSDTGAWLVHTRLPQLLALLAAGGEALRDGEAPQGEPLTAFLTTFTGAALFVPQEALEVPAYVDAGTIELGLGMPVPVARALRAAVLSVQAAKERGGRPWQSAPAPESFTGRFQIARLNVPWIRLDELPHSRDAAAFIAAAHERSPNASAPRWLPAQEGQIAPLGLLLPEEVRQGEVEQTWLVAVRFRVAGQRQPAGTYLLRGERLSAAELSVRIPALDGMQQKTVSLAGLGALGGPLAMELARAQVGALRLLDMDVVEAGNTVRWPFGVTAVGSPKSGFLAEQIQLQYPFTNVAPIACQIGNAQIERGRSGETEALTAFLDGSDLVIDATAELGVSQLLADIAADAGVPLLSAWGTEGGWGGAVAEIHPHAGGCWFCLQLAIERGAIAPPPAEPTGRVQPRGCSAPTFTATSFDMLEIVAQAMRCTRRVLLGESRHSTVHVCSTRGRGGEELPAPVWSIRALKRQAGCPCCAGA